MAKENISKMKMEPTVWENIFANNTSDKDLISKIHKELIWPYTRETNNPIKKWAKHSNRHFSKEDIQMASRYEKMLSITSHQRDANWNHNEISHLTQVRMAIINKSTNKCWWGLGENEILLHWWWESRLGQPLWKTVWNFLKKLKMDLLYNPVISLLGIYLKKPQNRNSKAYVHPSVHCSV